MSKTLDEFEAELRQDVQQARNELEQKELLLSLFLKRTVRVASEQGPTPIESASPADDNGIIQLDAFDVSRATSRTTLIDDIKDVISRFGAQEFTVVHVHKVLETRGVSVTGKFPRSRISVALQELSEAGFILRTFQGKGNVPNRYQLSKPLVAAA